MTSKGRTSTRATGASREGTQYPPAAESPLRQLAGLEIVVVAPEDDDISALTRELQRLRAQVRRLWPLPDLFPLEADVVICELLPGLAQRLPWVPGQAPLTFVLLVHAQCPADLKELMNCAPHGVLSRPVTVNGALAGLVLARSQSLYEQRLRSRIDKLDDNLRTMRSVEQAKSILMRQKDISEDEAYRFLRQQAMERRVSIGALAGVIVDSDELLS